jgi:vitamin K-dependent gamma-carboxylase
MMLRSKSATARFFATDPVRQHTWELDPRAYLTQRQLDKMSTRPDMILQFSHHLAHELWQPGRAPVEIPARVSAALNGRPGQLLLDPAVNLGAQPRTLAPASWIMPLVESLPKRTYSLKGQRPASDQGRP